MKRHFNLFLKSVILFSILFIYGFQSFGETRKHDNLSFGIPGKADTIVDRPGFALGYIEYHEQPAWVIYRMTRTEATTKAAKRSDKFRPDPEIPTHDRRLFQ